MNYLNLSLWTHVTYFHIFVSFTVHQSLWSNSIRKDRDPNMNDHLNMGINMGNTSKLSCLYKFLIKIFVSVFVSKISPCTSQSGPLYGSHCIYRSFRGFFKLLICQWEEKEIYHMKCQHKWMSWSLHHSFSWALNRKQADHLSSVYWRESGKGTPEEKCSQEIESDESRFVLSGCAWGQQSRLGEYLNTKVVKSVATFEALISDTFKGRKIH